MSQVAIEDLSLEQLFQEADRTSSSFSLPTSSSTCAQCRFYDRGICKVRAQAEWDNSTVKSTKKACFLAEVCPF